MVYVLLNKVSISKTRSASGKVEFHELPNMNKIEMKYEKSLPFSQSNFDGVPARGTENPDTARQHFFECCCHLLRLCHDGEVAPYRFRVANGSTWHMDKSAAWWLLESGNWEPANEPESDDFGLKLVK